jgi:hypothetical protein
MTGLRALRPDTTQKEIIQKIKCIIHIIDISEIIDIIHIIDISRITAINDISDIKEIIKVIMIMGETATCYVSSTGSGSRRFLGVFDFPVAACAGAGAGEAG